MGVMSSKPSTPIFPYPEFAVIPAKLQTARTYGRG